MCGSGISGTGVNVILDINTTWNIVEFVSMAASKTRYVYGNKMQRALILLGTQYIWGLYSDYNKCIRYELSL